MKPIMLAVAVALALGGCANNAVTRQGVILTIHPSFTAMTKAEVVSTAEAAIDEAVQFWSDPEHLRCAVNPPPSKAEAQRRFASWLRDSSIRILGAPVYGMAGGRYQEVAGITPVAGHAADVSTHLPGVRLFDVTTHEVAHILFNWMGLWRMGNDQHGYMRCADWDYGPG